MFFFPTLSTNNNTVCKSTTVHEARFLLRHHLVSLSRFDIYYKRIYLKPHTQKAGFYKIQKIPQKVGEKMAKKGENKNPRFWDINRILSAACIQNIPENPPSLFLKKRFPKFRPIFCKISAILWIRSIMLSVRIR